jgi:AraC-like DNA-binding protein
MIDELTPVLSALRIKTTLFAIADLPADWGVAFPAAASAYFHVVAGSSGWLQVDGALPRSVRSGDTVLLAHGSAHRLTSTIEAPPRVSFDPVRWKPNQLNPSGVAPAVSSGATLVCGAVEVHNSASQPLLSLLPDVFAVPQGDPGTDELGLSLRLLHLETQRVRSGSQTMLARLGDVLLVQLIRLWLERNGHAHGGWLAALRDPQLGPAMAALHADLAAAWTIDALAERARLSRSRFAERFTALVGQPPLSYLTQVRLNTAAALLRDGSSIRAASRAVGYQSPASFSRAFTRQHGMPPSRVRIT